MAQTMLPASRSMGVQERSVSRVEIGIGGAKLGLGGGKLEVVLAEAFEEGSDVVYMGSGVGVDHADDFEIGGSVFKVFDNFVRDLNKPPGRGTAALGHGPLEEPTGCVELSEGMESLSMVLWWNEETRWNREKMLPFPRESRTSSTREMESCPRELITFSFLYDSPPDKWNVG